MALRVTHCPVNVAGIPWQNVQALGRKGVDARLVVFNRLKLHPEADIDLERRGGFARKQAEQCAPLRRLLASEAAATLASRRRSGAHCSACSRGRTSSTSTSG